MIIFKNINSGEFFIYVKDINWEKIEVITPLNRIKILEKYLFEDKIEGVEIDLVNSGTITLRQLKAYQSYIRLCKGNHDEFIDVLNDINFIHNKSYNLFQLETQERGQAMKTIEIDNEVYNYLQDQAIPFEESTPNHVIRRILGLNNKLPQKENSIKKLYSTNGSKAPKAGLRKLVSSGILHEGQKLVLKYKGKLTKNYEAEIADNSLIYQDKTYKMSSLVAHILDQEGCGIPSKAYRGPEYWYTLDGISIRQLWEQYLDSN